MKNLPAETQTEIRKLLKITPKAYVWFENGKYHVEAGLRYRREERGEFAKDYRYIWTFTPEDVFTLDEQTINYAETFHDFPVWYKGTRDYTMMYKAGNNWNTRFTMVNGNLVIV